MIGKKVTLGIYCFFAFICFFCACGNNNTTALHNDNSIFSASTHKKLVTELELGDPQCLIPEMFAITNSYCYYGEVKRQDDYSVHGIRLFRINKGGTEGKQIYESDGDQILSFRISLESNEKEIISFLQVLQDKIYICELDRDGQEIRKIPLDLDLQKHEGPYDHLRLSDGKYLFLWKDGLCLFDPKEDQTKEFHFEGRNFLAIAELNNTIYVSDYSEKEKQSTLAAIDLAAGVLSEVLRIPGNGKLYKYNESCLMTLAPNFIVKIDLADLKYENLLDVSGFLGIGTESIITVWASDAEFQIVKWNVSQWGDTPELIRFIKLDEEEAARRQSMIESAEFDEYGRQIVELYDPTGLIDLAIHPQIIEEYNNTNEKYKVVVDQRNKDASLVIASKAPPDLMFLPNGTSVFQYASKGYLENLIPYLDASTKLSRNELQDYVFRSFEIEGGLYAITKDCCIQTLAGRRSQVGETSGWTVSEYLDWLEQHPDVIGDSQLDRMWVMMDCVNGNMDSYVDFQQKKAYFDQREFKEMLLRTKKMNFKHQVFDEYNAETDDVTPILLGNTIDHLAWLAESRSNLGDEVTIKGLPNDKGIAVSILYPFSNFCILKNGRNKEGAYDFLEYYLLRDEKILLRDKEEGYKTSGIFYSINRLYDLEKSMVLGLHKEESNLYGEDGKLRATVKREYEVTEKDLIVMRELLANAIVDTAERAEIQKIIYEEAQAYYLDQKELDVTCEIIQSRVQLLLNE